jgi:hypothetical protein
MVVIPAKAEALYNSEAGQSIFALHRSNMDSRFRALLSGKEFADLQKHEMRVRMSATVSNHHSHRNLPWESLSLRERVPRGG